MGKQCWDLGNTTRFRATNYLGTLCSTWIIRSVDGYGANFAPSSLAWDDTMTV